MTPREFEAYWRQHYDRTYPIADELRNAYANRWYRIHTLTKSKRYPETEEDYRQILFRHNKLLSDLFGASGRYALLTTGYSPKPTPVRSYAQLKKLDPEAKSFLSITKSDSEDDPYYWHFFMSEKIWQRNSLNELFRLVADNEVMNVLLVSLEKERIYHPYDGGADVIVESRSVRDVKRRKYIAWLPKNSYGL